MKKSLYYFIPLVLLLPLIFFPYSGDLAIFVKAGYFINHGLKPYVDFIDIKPPAIYYVFAFIEKIFGYSEIGIRLFDYLYQFITCLVLIKTINYFTSNRIAAFSAGYVYAIVYTALGYSQTTQVESLYGLLILGIINSYRLKNIYKYLSIGFLIGIITGLKYTAGLILAGVIIYELFNSTDNIDKKLSIRIHNSLFICLSFIFSLTLTLSPLFDSAIRAGYINTFSYTLQYSQIVPFNIDFIKILIRGMAENYAYNYTLPLTLLAFYGVTIILRNNINKSKYYFLIELSIIIFIFDFLSVIAEKKFFPYQFSRVFVPLIILTAYGGIELCKLYENRRNSLNYLSKSLLLFIILLGVLISPVLRYTKLFYPIYLYNTNISKYDELIDTHRPETYLKRTYQKSVANFINSQIQPQDKVFMVCTGSNQLFCFINSNHFANFFQSSFFLGSISPMTWINSAKAETLSSRYLIFSDIDGSYTIFGHSMSSWEAFINNKDLKVILDNNFKEIKDIGSFKIFKRNY